MGMMLYLIGCLPGIVMWSILTEKAVLWFGFDSETAILAQKYAYPYLVFELFWGLDDCFVEFWNCSGVS